MNEEYAREVARSWFELFANFQESLGDADSLTIAAHNEYIKWNMIYLARKAV